MIWTLTIAGVPTLIRAGSLNISDTLNGRTTAAFSVISIAGTYRPAMDAEVLIEENGSRVFGGLIERATERGLQGGAKPGIETLVSAGDFSAYVERRYVNETIPAGSLAAALAVVTSYLATYGVTLDGGQVTGPSLPELVYEYRPLGEVLNELSTLTAKFGEQYAWRIDPFKVLSMAQPSTVAAPFDLVGNFLPEVIGDLEVEPKRDHYANRVIVKVPARSEDNHVESFTGDGSSTLFQLQFVPTSTRGYVSYTPVSTGVRQNETLNNTGDSDPATWTYDAATNTINRNSGAPESGSAIEIIFNGTFSGLGIAEDAGEIAAHGLWEKVVVVDEVPSDETAQTLAEAYLAQSLTSTKTISYQTFEADLAPGQTQTVTVPARNLSGDAIVTDVTTRDQNNRLVREIRLELTAETNLGRRGWRDVYKDWLGDKAGETSGIGDGGGGVANVGPGGPPTAVQYNDFGKFGGEAEFTYQKLTNSIVCGGGGSSIDATAPESCQVFGFDNHIIDP
jgi:hypothetical protein